MAKIIEWKLQNLPLTGASESVSPCFRFRITLLLGSPSSEKYIIYIIMVSGGKI